MRKKFFATIDSSDNYGMSLDGALEKLKQGTNVKKMVGEDTLTAICRRMAYKNRDAFLGEKEKIGLIFATEYGNLTSMLEMSQKAIHGEYVSTKSFSNASISSASNATALLLESKGLNLTINSGYYSYISAIELAALYIDTGELDTCIIMTGDHYNEFSISDVKQMYPEITTFRSKVTISVLSVYPQKYYLEDINIIKLYDKHSMHIYFGDMLWQDNCDIVFKEKEYFASSFLYDVLHKAFIQNKEDVEVVLGRINNIMYRIKLKKV